MFIAYNTSECSHRFVQQICYNGNRTNFLMEQELFMRSKSSCDIYDFAQICIHIEKYESSVRTIFMCVRQMRCHSNQGFSTKNKSKPLCDIVHVVILWFYHMLFKFVHIFYQNGMKKLWLSCTSFTCLTSTIYISDKFLPTLTINIELYAQSSL